MLRNRIRKLFDLKKPEALTWDDWQTWHADTKKQKPVVYFLAETVPSVVGKMVHRYVTRPINDCRYGIRVRIFDRYHVVKTGLKPGYHDCDERLLHASFSLLVDYVEKELPSTVMKFDPDDEKKGLRHPWWSKGWWRFKAHRDPQMGLRHLRWEMGLGSNSPQQAEKGREVWHLYHWWKYVRPLRPDPHDASGWSDLCNNKTLQSIWSNRGKSKEQYLKEKEILELADKIQQNYDNEDEAMLIRLIKIRGNLWT